MSFFKINYNKEGRGVEKNAPEKNALFTGCELYMRNFWNFIKINFIYAVSSLPMFCIFGLFFTVFIYPHLSTVVSELVSAAAVESSQAELTYFGVFAVIFITELILMFGSGPSSSYFAYTVKCVTNEEHIWVWGDFLSKFKENFKQSMIVSCIDIVAVFFLFNAAYFYLTSYNQTQSLVYFILFALILLLSAVYIFMHGYIYQMIVTFNNKLSVLYKNAFILALSKLPQNLLLIFIPAAVTYFLFAVLNPVFAVILSAIFYLAATRFPIEFFAARTIKNILTANAEQNTDNADEKGFAE